ncbi:DNA-binding protein [Chryseobacterium taklimakanense]|uniref:helix-turn-helix domain-containing protein n=1 Tax=Chryseobacterium taklimakanense TaxID=536441 RepID=UPI000F5EFD3C|nr:helix-turn-helix domain-containing protein [Chryseobacterium taklimakanense]AZI22507.1 DNA-binding protein [Chryseobacterium taklimakanense]
MSVEIITKEDLKEFKKELLEDLQKIFNAETPEQKQWLKSAEVRKLLKISSGTLQTLRINGHLRYTKVGGTMYYSFQDIEKC